MGRAHPHLKFGTRASGAVSPHSGAATPPPSRPVRTTKLRREKRQGKWTQTVCVLVGPGDGVPHGHAHGFRRVY